MYLSWDNGSQKELIQEVPFNHSTKTICIKRYPIQIPTIEIKEGIEKNVHRFTKFAQGAFSVTLSLEAVRIVVSSEITQTVWELTCWNCNCCDCHSNLFRSHFEEADHCQIF